MFEMSKAAGLLGIKKTPDLCSCPLIHEFAEILSNQLVYHLIEVEVRTIYKTGVEVEAMHGASVVALSMYDMLKPIDKGIEISSIKLCSEKGGKTDFKDKFLDRKI